MLLCLDLFSIVQHPTFCFNDDGDDYYDNDDHDNDDKKNDNDDHDNDYHDNSDKNNDNADKNNDNDDNSDKNNHNDVNDNDSINPISYSSSVGWLACTCAACCVVAATDFEL